MNPGPIPAERYRERMNEIAASCSPNDRIDWTLQTAVTHWLEHRRVRVAKGTLNSEKSIVRNLVAGFGAPTRLRTFACNRRRAEVARVKR